MEIYQLKVFIEVARHLSFTEAADVLNLTQPAVSAKIKSLEIALGTPLFNRLGRSIELTSVGQYLFKKGPDLVSLSNHLLAEIEGIKQGDQGKIIIGSTQEILDNWLPIFLFHYRQSFPNIKVFCLSFESAELLYNAIVAREIDLGFSSLSFLGVEGVVEEPIDQIQYELIVSHQNPLAHQSWISIRELLSEPWVLFDTGHPSRLIFERRLSELGLSLADFSQLDTVDRPGLLRQYLLQGNYLSFVAQYEFQIERQANQLRAVVLEEFALPKQLFMVLPKSAAPLLTHLMPNKTPKHKGKRQGLTPLEHFIKLFAPRSSQAQKELLLKSLLSQNQSTSETTKIALRTPHFKPPITLSGTKQTFPLKIGIQNSTIQTAPAGIIMQRLGLLEHFLPRNHRYKETQYQVHWSNHTSGAPIIRGLQSGQLQIGILGDYPLLLMAAQFQAQNNPNTKTRLISFVASSPSGSGNDVIVPKQSHLSTLDDLKGRVIAVPYQSAAHGMILRSLQRSNLLDKVTLASINKLNLKNISNYLAAVDGYAYFAPFHEVACYEGRFRRLLDGSLTVLPTFHGIVVQETLAAQHPDIVVAYLQALIAAQSWYQHNAMAPQMVSQWVGLEADIVTKTLAQKSIKSSLFFPETQIRLDWLSGHIQSLITLPDHKYLEDINLSNWVDESLLIKATQMMNN
ncbi:MAG: LysR substrate-binding domain-containing protein [Cyanobacteria bacterium P01_G01_bin.54]